MILFTNKFMFLDKLTKKTNNSESDLRSYEVNK